MYLKNKLFQILKYAGASAACLALVSDVDAQSHLQRTSNLQLPSQELQVVDTAPNLLRQGYGVANAPQSTAAVAQRPQVSSHAQQRGFVPAHNRTSRVQLATYSRNTNQVFGESVVDAGCSNGGCASGGCTSCGVDPGYGVGVGCGVDVGCADPGCGIGNFGGLACGVDTGCAAAPCNYPVYPALISFSDMEYFVGAHAFKGAMNLGEGGSFGFNEGVNWGFPLPIFQGLGLSGQLGARFTQSNGNGGGFTNETREQIFVSGGIFRRVDYGLQMGIAYDFLREEWYFDGSFGQIRGEFSWVGHYGNTMGLRYTADFDEEPGVGAVAAALVPAAGPFSTFVPHDTFRFFYEQKFRQTGAIADIWGGFSGDSQGMVGANATIPLTQRFVVRTTGTLLIDDSTGNTANIDEGWNIGVSLVYIPKGWCNWRKAYHRPLMDVADNGSFLVGRQ